MRTMLTIAIAAVAVLGATPASAEPPPYCVARTNPDAIVCAVTTDCVVEGWVEDEAKLCLRWP